MVPVGPAGVRELHLVAHRALMSMRSETDYWEHRFDAAMAVWALTAHGPSQQPPAGSLDRLTRETLRSEVRVVTSEELVPNALTAAALRRLLRADKASEARIYDDLTRLAERGSEVVPPLHVLLAAVALRETSSAWPDALWTALRAFFADDRTRRLPAAGVVAVGAEISRQPLHPDSLLSAALQVSSSASSLGERCIAAWVLSFAIEATTTSSALPRFQLAVIERDRVVEALATEITAQTFEPLQQLEFDPGHAAEPIAADRLTVFEAALLEAAIAPRTGGQAWLSRHEAEAIYGAKAKRVAIGASVAIAAAASLASATVALGVHLSSLRPLAVGYFSVVAPSAVMLTAPRYLGEAGVNERVLFPLRGFLWTLLVTSALLAIDQTRSVPFLPDSVGLIASLVIPAFVAIVVELRRPRIRRPPPEVIE